MPRSRLISRAVIDLFSALINRVIGKRGKEEKKNAHGMEKKKGEKKVYGGISRKFCSPCKFENTVQNEACVKKERKNWEEK